MSEKEETNSAENNKEKERPAWLDRSKSLIQYMTTILAATVGAYTAFQDVHSNIYPNKTDSFWPIILLSLLLSFFAAYLTRIKK